MDGVRARLGLPAPTLATNTKKGNHAQGVDTATSVGIAEAITQYTKAGNFKAQGTLPSPIGNCSPHPDRHQNIHRATKQIMSTPAQWVSLSRYLEGYDDQETFYILTGFQEDLNLDFNSQEVNNLHRFV